MSSRIDLILRSAVRTVCAVLLVVFMASAAFAVTMPSSGTYGADGRYIYIPDITAKRIRVLDTTLLVTNETILSDSYMDAAVVNNYTTPANRSPYAMAMSPAGDYLYVSLAGATCVVAKYPVSGGTLGGPTTMNPDPSAVLKEVALSPTGAYLYVADSMQGKVYVIRTSDMAYIRTINAEVNAFGLAVRSTTTNKRLYVSIRSDVTGKVMVFNLDADESNPTLITSSGALPLPSHMVITPDGSKLFVRIYEKVPTYRDVIVYNTSTGALVTSTTITLSGAGNHVYSGIDTLEVYGYDDINTNRSWDYKNGAAEPIGIDPKGRFFYFAHYNNNPYTATPEGQAGVSGNGIWYWNIALYRYRIEDLPTGSVGTALPTAVNIGYFRAADGIIMNGHNVFMTYSGTNEAGRSGMVQAAAFEGPYFVYSFNATSNEAIVGWEDLSFVTDYEIRGRIITGTSPGAWVSITVPYNTKYVTTEVNPNIRLTGLTPMTTYEVQVRGVVNSGSRYSKWAPNEYATTETFYTLEPVWVSHYGTTSNETTILFGPVISKDVKTVPYAVSYDLQRRLVGGGWTTITGIPTTSAGDPTNTTNLTYKLTGLTEGLSYEVRMRSVDSTGGISEWSSIEAFMVRPTPWVGAFNVNNDSCWVQWGSTGGTLSIPGVESYELYYRITGEANWTTYEAKFLGPTTQEDTSVDALNIYFTGNGPALTQFTTYEVRLRGVYPDSSKTEWSNTDSFYTWWVWNDPGTGEVGGPDWASAFNITSNEATVNCEYVNDDVQFEFQYREIGEPSWQSKTIANYAARFDPADPHPNAKLTGLDPGSLYELRARAYDPAVGYSDWSTTFNFYTLERPWVDWYPDPTGMIVYVIWGPEITKGHDIPYATGYNWRYKVNGGNWIVSSEVLLPGRKDDGTNDNYNFKFPNLAINSSYEVEVRALDASGGVSLWSDSKIFYTGNGAPYIYQPWISHYGVTTKEAAIIWGWSCPLCNPPVDHYEFTYRVNGGSWEVYSGTSAPLTNSSYYNNKFRSFLFTGLTPYATYEVRIRALDGAGNQIGNMSSIDTFHTFYQLWVRPFNVTTNEAYIQWGVFTNEVFAQSSDKVPTSELGSYQLQFRKTSTTEWTDYTGPTWPLDNNAQATNEAELNALMKPLDTNTSYEVRARAVHTSGFVSDWSKIESFTTNRGPWWINVKKITTREATVYWDDTPRSPQYGAISYTVSYGKDEFATSEGQITGIASSEKILTTLETNTTYFVKVRAVYPGGGVSSWSDIKSFVVRPYPEWVGHYLVSSKEATINWPKVPSATSYTLEYRLPASATWTPVTGITTWDSSTDANPHYRVSGLVPLSTYEARVKAMIGTLESLYSPVHEFYTLERPWVDFYKPGATSVYIVWGPEVSINEVNVPLSDHYELMLRENGGAWIPYIGVIDNTTFNDPTSPKHTLLLTGLNTASSYEVAMRTIDGTGGHSDWSGIYGGLGNTPNPPPVGTSPSPIFAVRAPWWIDARNITTREALAFWDGQPTLETTPAVSYILSYGTDEAAINKGQITGITLNEKILTTLEAYKTYYIKVRAVYPTTLSNWTSIESFFTMEGPDWIATYNVSTNEAFLTWEAVSTPGATYEVSYGTDVSGESLGKIGDIKRLVSLTPDTWYYVKVRSYAMGYVSPWCNVTSFFTMQRPVVDIVNVTDTNATATWETIPSVTSYEVVYGTTLDAAGEIVGSTISNVTNIWTDLAPPALITGKVYYVRVRAYKPGGYSGWSDLVTFTASKDPAISLTVPAGGTVYPGATIKINGSNFGTSMGTVEFGSVKAAAAYWKDDEIAVCVPQGFTSGDLRIISALGKVATGPAFAVDSTKFMLDDFEGGMYNYSFGFGIGTQEPYYADKHEGIASRRINYSYVAPTWGGGVGGIMPTSDAVPVASINLTAYGAVTLWIKGDGSTNVVSFELTEAYDLFHLNTATSSEVWMSTVPIPIPANDGLWHQVTIPLTASSFTRDASWRKGDDVLNLDAIHGYQLVYRTPGVTSPTQYHYVDEIMAVPAPIPGTKSFTMRSTVAGNINWITVPFTGTGLNTTTDLATSIGNIIPIGNRNFGDTVIVNLWDATSQTQTPYMTRWNGSSWIQIGGNASIQTGAMYKVAVPYGADGRTWTVSGNIPAIGSVQFTLQYVAGVGNYNWISIPAYSAGLLTTTNLGAAIGSVIPSPNFGDAITVYKWDAVNQLQTPYIVRWNGSTWITIGSSSSIETPGAYMIGVPLSADNRIWP